MLITFILCSCTKSNSKDCGEKICTTEFRMVTVKFSDETGKTIIVKDFSAINKRTGKAMASSGQSDPASYVVASDSNKGDLSESGDVILVSATNPQTDQKKQAEFVIGGGPCACHISKISGPDLIVF